MSANEAVAITGLGMRTGVGTDAVQSCACIRAGVNRFAEWPHFADGNGDTGLIASAAIEEQGDLPWIDKVEALVSAPIHEVIWDAELFELLDGNGGRRNLNCTAYLSVPYEQRVGVDQKAYSLFLADAKEHCIAPVRDVDLHVIPSAHAGGLLGLAKALSDLQSRRAGVCLVGGVDSLLSAPYLGQLADEGKLKVGGRPSGLIPGEGAAFVSLERLSDARKRGARIYGQVSGVAIGREERPVSTAEPVLGEAHTKVAFEASRSAAAAGGIHRVISDLNGERWRFMEWAMSESRLSQVLRPGWELWHPADCIGDVGAAYAPLALGVGARAFERGYGGEAGILVCASSEAGERAACCLMPE